MPLIFLFEYKHKPMAKIYNQLLEKYPLTTKCTTSGALFSLGDFLTQTFIQKQPFDLKRNVDFFIVGFGYIAPCLHLWYCKGLPFISGKIFSAATAKPIKVFGQMLLDQFMFAPILLTGFFPCNQMIVDRDIKSFQKGVQVWKDKIWETLQSNWKIWPLASTINFWLMPVQYQVLFANFVGLFWNMILSYITCK